MAKRKRKYKRINRKPGELTQIGKSNIFLDLRYAALKPGKRISASGKRYYEYRANRSDKNRERRL